MGNETLIDVESAVLLTITIHDCNGVKRVAHSVLIALSILPSRSRERGASLLSRSWVVAKCHQLQQSQEGIHVGALWGYMCDLDAQSDGVTGAAIFKIVSAPRDVFLRDTNNRDRNRQSQYEKQNIERWKKPQLEYDTIIASKH